MLNKSIGVQEARKSQML